MIWGLKIIKWRWLNDPKNIEKPLKAMVWGLKIIKWQWLNDPKTIEKTIECNCQLLKK